jgi:alpha-beta hydrolase superfamily lysophospholipase
MSTWQNLTVNWTNVPTRTITAGGVEFAYRELGTNNPGTTVVFLIHLAAVLDNWDPRVVDGLAASRHVVTFDNRGVGASSGAPATSIEQMATDAILFIRALGFTQVDLFGFSMGGMIVRRRTDAHSSRAMKSRSSGPHVVVCGLRAGWDPAKRGKPLRMDVVAIRNDRKP